MSVNEYLLLSNIKYYKAGTICKFKEEEIKMIKANPKNQIIELSVEESLFYKIYNENVRIERHHADLFNKAKLLQKNYECYLKVRNKNVKVQILDRDDRKSEPIFKYKDIDGMTKLIQVSAIEDVFSVIDIQDHSKAGSTESPEPVMKTDLHENKKQIIEDGYYILSRKYTIHQRGAIIRVRDGLMFNIDDEQVIMDIEQVRDFLINIEKEEARYLKKFPKDKRMKKKEKEMFTRIKNLHVGQECDLKGIKFPQKSYTVLKTNVTYDGIKFDLRPQGNRSIVKDVDESQITFRKKESQKTSGFLSPATSESITFGRQGSKDSTSSNDYSSLNKPKQGIPKTIFCEPINGNVINPIQIKRIQLNDDQKFDKYIVINAKSKSVVVKLLWKGMVDDQICLGCDLLVDWSEGTDGEFNDHSLFSCNKKRGVLIPVDDNLNTCESTPRQHKVLSSDTVIIKEEDICCVETARDQNIYINKTIIVDQNCKIKGICKWTGLVNGRECVMIVSDMLSGKYRHDRIVDNMKLCHESYSDLSIIEAKSIPKTIFCAPIHGNVINPTQIKIIQLKDEQKLDKYIVINIKSKSSVVKLLWKGLVDDQICLGCDLLVDWSNGTDGEFNDHSLFSCDNKRGVLIPVDDKLNTCESTPRQHKVLSRDTVIIKEEDICCVETAKDQNIYLNKTIIADQNFKIKGICKWTGLVNGRECIMIVSESWMPSGKYVRNKIVDNMKLCHESCCNLSIIETKNIPKTIFCEPINEQVIYPIQLKDIEISDKQKLDKYIIINTKGKSFILKLLWKGLVNSQIILGCDLLTDWSEGTDGEFNGEKLFSCNRNRGVLIPQSSLMNSCILKKHRDIQISTDKFEVVKEDCICCVETMEKFPSVNIDIGKQLKYGQNQMLKGSCAWLGMINGVQCVGILYQDYSTRHYKCDGLIRKVGICGIEYSRCAIVTLDALKSVKFVNDLFVENTSKIDNKIISRETNMYKIGQLIQAGEDPVFCGLVEFFLKYSNDDLVGLKVNEDQISKNTFGSKIKFEAPLFTRNDLGIIVKTKGTEALKEEVELMNNSKLIKPDSIKYKEKYNLPQFKIGDIVKFNFGEPDNCFRVDNVWMLNKVPCVEVSKATKMNKSNSVKYVRAQDIVKYDASDIQTRYFQDTIVDCESVKVWEKVDLPNISVGDKVEFVIRKTEERCKGIVQHSGKANKIASCIVQLLTNLGNANAYRINETKRFMKYCKNIEDPMVIVPADILQKHNKTVTTSGIPIIDPEAVKTVNGKETSEKYIAFKSNNKSHFLFLKWRGFVNGIYCFGGEIDGGDLLGTNGTFAGKPLFKCKEKCGVLILSDEVTDCCLNKNHNDWMIREEKIVETSICCIKTKAKLNENNQITIHERLQKKNSKVTGTCIWMGLVNNKEAVFIEFGDQIHVGSGGGKHIFHFRLSRGAFFEASGFAHELQRVPGMAIKIINPFNIKAIENGKEIKKIICTKIKQKKETLNLKWRGVVNGELCVGCQLSIDVEYGSDGCYHGSRLFTCPENRGVLIPVDQIGDSCECTGIHTEIEKNQVYLSYLRGGLKTLKFDSVCCIEWLENIQKLPRLCLESSVKYKDLIGTCKWIGLMNGKEVVGVEMDKEFKEGTNGTFDTFDLFTCDPGKGCLFMAEDIIHDEEAEKLHFVEDEVVDIEKINNIKPLKNFAKFQFTMGDPVITFINTTGYFGELKWAGLINNKSCVGLDLEDAIEHGMDGRICGQIRFQCPEGHGLITPLAKIQYYDVANKLHQYENGLINPYKYMKCEEKYDRRFLDERKINKNGLVFVTVSGDNEQTQLKGTLRWCGLMNDIPVGAVELDQDHTRGTDGTFWRQRLFHCKQKRAVAVLWDRITEYIPYETRPIPEENKIFPDININTAVKYFHTIADDVKDLYGTVRWTGVDETGEYFFGIELDDRIPGGTDGEFLGQRLFHCAIGHGILAPLDLVMKDTRFVEEVVDPVDIEESAESTRRSFGILTRLTEGLNRGIQGNANSCYFDSAIFALFVNTDVLDFMISPNLNDHEKDEVTKEFRKVLAWKIVYPLREKQFVSFHRTAEMRNIILKYGAKFAEMTKQESDMENVSSLLSMLCSTEQLLSIVSFNSIETKSMFLQLFLFVQKRVKFMTSEKMLKMSMVENDIMFKELPSCLIFQAPRDAGQNNCYEYVIPSKTIEISEICANHYRKCCKCTDKAKYQCKDCMKENNFDITTCLFCDSHKCGHEFVMKIPDFPTYSQSKVFYTLKAIICIDKCHFVAYVNENDKWFFFDSMSTQSLVNNYAIPGVTYSKVVSDFLNMSDEDKKNDIESYYTNEIKRVAKDSYVFVYHNATRTCY